MPCSRNCCNTDYNNSHKRVRSNYMRNMHEKISNLIYT